MAMAEAKPSRKKTVNHCSNEEDAVGFQKKSSTKLKSHGGPGDAADSSKHTILDCMAYNKKFSCPDLGTETKWWLNRRPDFGEWNDVSYEQLSALDSEMEVLGIGSVSSTAKFSGECKLIEEDYTQTHTKANAVLCLDQPYNVASNGLQNDQNSRIQELKAVYDGLHRAPIDKDMTEFWCTDDLLMKLKSDISFVSEQHEKLFSDTESLWIGVDKAGPWWRTSDKDDFASLVSFKSQEQIENCDLPCSPSQQLRRKSCTVYHPDYNFHVSSDMGMEKELHIVSGYMQGTTTSVNIGETLSGSVSLGSSPDGTDAKPSWNDVVTTKELNKTESKRKPCDDLSKAQLLEALCHSQTRAREAEKAAQQAHDEKEHILKILFRQASYLFAYKQWLQILQLESLCLQLRSKGELLATPLPALFPWILCKNRKTRNRRRKAAKRRQGSPRYNVNKCAIAFAMGLGLAGAGLLLGWTMGWLFPAI